MDSRLRGNDEKGLILLAEPGEFLYQTHSILED
jgi:hypothetical protein